MKFTAEQKELFFEMDNHRYKKYGLIRKLKQKLHQECLLTALFTEMKT